MAKNLNEWLQYLQSIHPSSIDMGLQRVQRVAEKLQFNWHSIRVVTVGGTNGKGTTCKFLEDYLQKLGLSVATFRSPHLLDYRERVTLNGEMQAEQEYVDAFEQVEAARKDITLTYFEFGTLAALVMMRQWQPNFVLLEVGLGGRLDATNIVDNNCAVITTIGLDHQEYLGDTREAIASEKAGIFRTGKPLVIGELNPPKTLITAAHGNNSDMALANQHFTYSINSERQWSWQGKRCTFNELPLPNIPVQNASTALATLEILGIPLNQELVEDVCSRSQLQGRRQVIQQSPYVMLDVAHNPQAAQSLLPVIQEKQIKGNIHLVVGMLKDKDIANTLACFKHIDATWHLANTQGPRACLASELAKVVQSNNVFTYNSVESAYIAAVQDSDSQDSIFVFGSFLTVADVLAYQGKKVSA